MLTKEPYHFEAEKKAKNQADWDKYVIQISDEYPDVARFARNITNPSLTKPYPRCYHKPNNLKQDFVVAHAVFLKEEA